uniref:PARP catalytic domain-containing protein n=1 Tax=Steinernema glaseri TaxID=37863 RepID=A0A1I7Y0A8_9BILA
MALRHTGRRICTTTKEPPRSAAPRSRRHSSCKYINSTVCEPSKQLLLMLCKIGGLSLAKCRHIDRNLVDVHQKYHMSHTDASRFGIFNAQKSFSVNAFQEHH